MGSRRSDLIGGGGTAHPQEMSDEDLALLDSLHLATDTEHLSQLRAVLRMGLANHYQDPAAGQV